MNADKRGLKRDQDENQNWGFSANLRWGFFLALTLLSSAPLRLRGEIYVLAVAFASGDKRKRLRFRFISIHSLPIGSQWLGWMTIAASDVITAFAVPDSSSFLGNGLDLVAFRVTSSGGLLSLLQTDELFCCQSFSTVDTL